MKEFRLANPAGLDNAARLASNTAVRTLGWEREFHGPLAVARPRLALANETPGEPQLRNGVATPSPLNLRHDND